MDSISAHAPPQPRQKQKPQKETAPLPQLGRHRVEPRPVATQPPSPPRRPILWREAPKLWRDEKPPKKKKKKENEAAAISAREMAGAKINQKELVHFMQFLLCQLRWQAGKIVDGNFEAFDEEMRRVDTQSPDDVASCQQSMAKFLDGPAAGDRWVPWHTVTCEMELFLMTKLRTASDLDDKEKFVLATAFSGSRWCPLFQSVVYPYFSRALDTDQVYEGEERRAILGGQPLGERRRARIVDAHFDELDCDEGAARARKILVAERCEARGADPHTAVAELVRVIQTSQKKTLQLGERALGDGLEEGVHARGGDPRVMSPSASMPLED